MQLFFFSFSNVFGKRSSHLLLSKLERSLSSDLLKVLQIKHQFGIKQHKLDKAVQFILFYLLVDRVLLCDLEMSKLSLEYSSIPALGKVICKLAAPRPSIALSIDRG